MSYIFYGPGLGTNGGGTPEESAASVVSLVDSVVSEEEGAPETLFEQGWEWFREIAGGKSGTAQPQQQAAPMPGATADGKPTAAGFSEYAREAAVREVATVDEEQAPIQEVPSDSPQEQQAEQRSWIEQYQTHITIISTLVGLGTFIVWLMIRKKS